MYTLIKYFLFAIINFAHAEMGDINNPVLMAMVPGLDSIILKDNATIIQKCLETETKLNYKLFIPTSFVAIVEAFGTKRVDLAFMNTFGYILASEKYNSHVRLIGTFKGQNEYWGQIIARNDGPKSIKELNNKTFAFVDPASTSGYILANKALEDEKIKLKSSLFAGKHDSVVSMVYQGRVDAGATYHTLPVNNVPQDARTLVLAQYPDVMEKIKILKITGPIPSDPIVFGKHVPLSIENNIVDGLLKCVIKSEVKDAFLKTYHLDGLNKADDSHWNKFRKTLKEMNKSPQQFLKN